MHQQGRLTLEQIGALQVDPNRCLHSATHEEILGGATTDIYFIRTVELLEKMGKDATPVWAEVFPQRSGFMAGTEEVVNLLRGREGLRVWGLPEGNSFQAREVVMQIEGPYHLFGYLETVLLGMLASSCGWADAARQCREAAGEKGLFAFGARHVHPSVAPVMERAALVGGADGASCILGAKLRGQNPKGTIPHAAFLIVGDTVEVARAYHEYMPSEAPRLILVDTFKDEAEETLRVAHALGENLAGVRLDTPGERGGVTPEMVNEIRQRLNQAGFSQVKIFVSGGVTPERISILGPAGADAFGVGSYISRAAPIDMTMDLKEIDGIPLAKRGRVPGRTLNDRLVQLL